MSLGDSTVDLAVWPGEASEQADASANRLFMQATGTAEAAACFSRFVGKVR